MSELLDKLSGFKSPYLGRINLDAQRGDWISGETNDEPVLLVLNVETVKVNAIKIQIVKLADEDTDEEAYVRRTVAELENGNEMDIAEPVGLDAQLCETGIDTSKCDACGSLLTAVDLVILDGKAYHKYCLEDGDAA